MSFESHLQDPPDAAPYLCHYTTRDTAFGIILPEGQLRLSPYSRMRDPLEAKPSHLGAGYTVPDDADADRAIQIAFWEANLELRKLRRGSRLLSLTADAQGYTGPDAVFGRGWARARMWEQYAEQHAGVCLVFSGPLLKNLFCNS